MNMNMVGKWVMIVVEKKKEEFDWKRNLVREVIEREKRVVRRKRERRIRMNGVVDEEIKIRGVVEEEMKIVNEDE